MRRMIGMPADPVAGADPTQEAVTAGLRQTFGIPCRYPPIGYSSGRHGSQKTPVEASARPADPSARLTRPGGARPRVEPASRYELRRAFRVSGIHLDLSRDR